MAVEQIGTGGTDGQRLGVSGGKLGFYGTDPVARPSVTWRNTTTATTTTNKQRINRIYAALTSLGLFVTT